MRYAFALLACTALAAWGLHAEADDRGYTGRPDEQLSRLITLYKADPLSHSISLATGLPGSMMQKDGISNIQSDIDFGNYAKDALTVGIEGGREGVILDLGDQEALATLGDYAETVGGGQGFARVQLGKDGHVVFGNGQRVAADKVWSARGDKVKSARPIPGHVYIVRITERGSNFERIVKLLVVSHRPDDSVTFRWTVLREK